MNRILTIFLGTFLICFCLFDNYAARFGTGIFFKSYNELDFELKVEFYEANFNIVTNEDFPLVHSGYYFPTGSKSNSKRIFVDSVFGMWVENKNLYVRIIDNFEKKKILRIKNISANGVALDYDILETDVVSQKNEKGVYFDRSFLFMFALNWVVFFPILGILGVLNFRYLWKYKKKSEG